MIISKKKFEAMVNERVNAETSRIGYERYIDDRFNGVHRRISELERRLEDSGALPKNEYRGESAIPCSSNY